MARIATFYDVSHGRNDGQPLYYTLALKALGHDVVHFSGRDTGDLATYGKFSAYFWVDWGEDGLHLDYTPISLKDKHPSIYIPCDTHIGPEYRLTKANDFDYVFFNQKRGLNEYVSLHPDRKDVCHWLPCGVDLRAYPKTPVAIKKYDIGFVGFVTFEKRALALDRMFREFPNFFFGQRLFEDAAEKYRKSKIVFSTATVDDIQMRIFEATATGSFLLIEKVPYLDELYEDGKHLVTYTDLDDAVAKAKYYLDPAHEAEREAIAKAGMEHTLAHHTYIHRAQEMLKVVGIPPVVSPPNPKDNAKQEENNSTHVLRSSH